MLCLAVAAEGCLSGGDRAVPPDLVMTPPSALPGDDLAVTVIAPGIDLSYCSDAEESLIFTDPEGGHSISVYRIDRLLLDSSSFRAYLLINAEARVGIHKVQYLCNDVTTLTGEFRVERPPVDVTLTVSPSALAAGSYGRTLVISTDVAFFTDNTAFYFEYPDMVTVSRKRRNNSNNMELQVDIQPLTPLGEMRVQAVENGKVAEGVLTVTDRVKSSLQVEPDEAIRQAAGQNAPPRYRIHVRAEGINLVGESEDAEAATTLDFPENPGITVVNEMPDDIRVVESADGKKELQADILVDSLAFIGSTPLRITTGNQEAWADFTVLLPAGTPLLKVTSPSAVPRNGAPTKVFLEAVNFDFAEVEEIRCREEGCAVTNVAIEPEAPRDRMSLDLTVKPSVTARTVAVQVKKADFTAEALLEVKDSDSMVITLDSDGPIVAESGNIQWLEMTFSEDVPIDAVVQVLARSGIRVDSRSIDTGQNTIVALLEVASDAPLGTAYVSVVSDGTVFAEVPLKIEAASENVAQMTLSPTATLRKRDTVLVEVTASGFDLPETPEGFAFDDPGLRVRDVYPLPDSSAVLVVDVSPAARTDMAVLYAKSISGKAAATFRVLTYQKREVLAANPVEVYREGSSASTLTVTVPAEDTLFDLPVVDVCDDIGVDILRISGGRYLVFDMLVAPEQGYGGGWIGLNVKNGADRYLVPIHVIAGDNDSLSAVLNPNEVPPGTERTRITAKLPDALSLDGGVLEVQTDHPGVFASEPVASSTSEHFISFWLDVARDALSLGGDEVKVFVTTANGVGVGLLTITEPTVRPILEGESWSGALNAGETTRFSVEDPGPNFPTLFWAGTDGAQSGVPEILLASDNKVDTAEISETGIVWMMAQRQHFVDVISADGASDASVHVRSRGWSSIVEDPDAAACVTAEGVVDETLCDWVVEEDPCEKPFLGRGAIEGALDVDALLIDRPSCPLVAVAAARDLAARAWETPDLLLEYDDLELQPPPIGQQKGTGYKDPIMLITPASDGEERRIRVALSAELGTAGPYLINIRSPLVIREFSLSESAPYVEIGILPDMNLTDCELELYDVAADETVRRIPLAELPDPVEGDTDPSVDPVPAGKGVFVVAGSKLPSADLVDDVALLPPDGDFALILYYKGRRTDAVQLGKGEVSIGEGSPLFLTDSRTVFLRIADVDTDDNAFDFLATFLGTPGY